MRLTNVAGRRDDLWSWLYMLVEMLEGALPWRVDRVENQSFDAAEKEAAKELALEMKQQCMENPSLLTTNAACPGWGLSLQGVLLGIHIDAQTQ